MADFLTAIHSSGKTISHHIRSWLHDICCLYLVGMGVSMQYLVLHNGLHDLHVMLSLTSWGVNRYH